MQPALLLASVSFAYSLIAAAAVVLVTDFFNEESHSEALLFWLLVPIVACLTAWLAVILGEPLLRAWVWFCIVATAFTCWIAAFDYGPVLVPLLPMLLLTAVTPWRETSRP